MSVDVPKQVAQAPLAVRSIFAPFHDKTHVESSGHRVLGGIYMIELLAIPPPPKKVKVGPVLHTLPSFLFQIQ